MNCRTLLGACAVLCVAALQAFSQAPPYQEDLQFVQRLRARGDHALALEFLQRLAKNPSPELAKELPLEFAKTNLAAAAEEQETTKKMAIYQQARVAFQQFLEKNPGHPRTAETNLDIAQVSIQEGRTQLSRALAQETEQARRAEAIKARTILIAAGERLDTGVKQLTDQLSKMDPKSPAEKAQFHKLDEDRLHADITRALNQFDIALTYLGTEVTERTERAAAVQKARDSLEKLAKQDHTNPSIWEVEAWLARSYNELGDPKKAMAAFNKIVTEKAPEAMRGQRLARYFALLVLKENPAVADNKTPVAAQIREAAERWLRDYPRATKSPEGYGVRYLLAWAKFAQIEQMKPPPPEASRNQMLDELRAELRPIEQSENDYADDARRLKITIIGKEGAFTKDIDKLKRFEECAARAQYEMYQLSEDLKKIDDPKLREIRRTERQGNAMKALEFGLTLSDAKPAANGRASFEVNAARTTLTYFYLDAKRYKDAIQTGEVLARSDSRAQQAPSAAMLALEAYALMIGEREKKFESEAELKPDMDRMLDLAKYMEDTWKGDLPAEMARHEVGLLLLRRKKLREGILKLAEISPAYTSYPFAQYQLGEASIQAEKDRLEPLAGDDYRTRAIKAFRNVPESSLGGDAALNQTVILSRIRLGQELYPKVGNEQEKAKAYEEMEKIADGLLPKIDAVRVSPNAAEDKELRAKFKASLTELKLYARLGNGDAAAKANQPAKVAEMLDPIVDQIVAGAIPDLPKNPQLGYALIGLDVKANTLLGKLDRTGVALKAMKRVSANGGSASILGLLADLMRDQVEETRKKNDAEGLKKLQTGFGAILDDLAKQEANPTPEFGYLLAKNFTSLGLYEKATAILEKVPEPKPKEGAKEVDKADLDFYHATRLLQIRCLRLRNQIDKAEAALKEIMKPLDNKQPNWGATNLDALLEQVLLFEDKKEFGSAYNLASKQVAGLKNRTSADFREKYFEFYFHATSSYYHYGQSVRDKDKAKGDKAVHEAAKQVVALQKAWNGYGSDESAKRFQAFLDAEPELKSEVEKLTPKSDK